MLRTFRKGADGFLAKIMLGFLVLTFALWGVGDMVVGGSDQIIAKVGEATITRTQLENVIRSEQQRAPELTAEVAQSLPVRLQFTEQMINARLLELEAESMGINFSEEALSTRIAADAAFQNEAGQFDRGRFLGLLSQNNLSQQAFLQRYESDLKISLLHGLLTEAMIAPKGLAELYYHIEREQREAKLIVLDGKSIKGVKAPDDEALNARYELSKEEFREPEYRTYRYIYFNSDMIAKSLSLKADDKAVRAYYDANPEEFRKADGKTEPFKDVKKQIGALLSEQHVAEKLIQLSNELDDSVAGGATLEEALDAAGLKKLKVETLGPITAGGALKNGELYETAPVDEEILRTAFDQPAGEISPITISADHYYFLVETLETIPSRIPNLDEVKKDLTKLMKAEKENEALQQKAESIATALQEAENPVSAAKERGVRLYDSGKLSRRSGEIARGRIKGLKLNAAFHQALFRLRINEASPAIPLVDGRQVIALLTDVYPAKTPSEVQLAPYEAALKRQIQQQSIGDYLSALREKYGVELFMDELAASTAEN